MKQKHKDRDTQRHAVSQRDTPRHSNTEIIQEEKWVNQKNQRKTNRIKISLNNLFLLKFNDAIQP